MTKKPIFRFERPENLPLVRTPTLSVAIITACRDGQEKLNLLMASLAAQTYPKELVSVHVIDDGSKTPIEIPAIAPKKSKVIRYKNTPSSWGKTAATNDVASTIKADVFWFVDADMVFEKEHLAHHMKWHHDGDGYAVLGWKRFVQEWDNSPQKAFEMINFGKFADMHSESWVKELWENRIEKTEDLLHPGLDGYRSFVGATFSIKSTLWKKMGGYRRELVTGEDTELGWRLFMEGIRIIPERRARSWHLGYSTVESNKELIDRHNQPSLAQYIPEMKKVRACTSNSWVIPTYEAVIDVQNSNLKQLQSICSGLTSFPGTQANFILLGSWSQLKKRYSPVSDRYGDLREISNWLKSENNVTFQEEGDENLKIEKILSRFTNSPIPFHIFIDGDFDGDFDGKLLCDYLLAHEYGLVGLATKQDRRAFAVFQPALARSISMPGSIYQNLSATWGVLWLTHESFVAMHSGSKFRRARAVNFLKREGKKVNSPQQLLIFTKKLFSVLLHKALK